ncbi:hypothetical protein ACJX0J_032949, partial [Zea mays]
MKFFNSIKLTFLYIECGVYGSWRPNYSSTTAVEEYTNLHELFGQPNLPLYANYAHNDCPLCLLYVLCLLRPFWDMSNFVRPIITQIIDFYS